MWVNPEIPENTRHTRKYPKYPEIPESKKDTRKYPIVYFDTPTRPEPDPLPGILFNTRPDIEKPYLLGTVNKGGTCVLRDNFRGKRKHIISEIDFQNFFKNGGVKRSTRIPNKSC